MSAKDILEHLIPHKQMQFAPIPEDDDELSEAIRNDPSVQDDLWELTESLDAQALDNFWTEALQELEPEERLFADE